MSVLTVITRESGALALARFGYRVARAREEKLVVLCLERPPSGPLQADDEPVSIYLDEAIPKGVSPEVVEVYNELQREPHANELRAEDELGEVETVCRVLPDPEVEIRWMLSSHRLRAVLAQVEAIDASLLIAAKHKPRSKREPLARKLFTAAPCHTLLARLGDAGDEGVVGRKIAGEPRPEGARCDILVPTAGGPHAAVALRLGERLARAEGSRVVPLYVASDAAELADEVGKRILRRAMVDARVEDSRHVAARVELEDDRADAIARVAAEDFGLILIGDSNVGSLRRRLFGTLPEHLLAGERGLQLAVVRCEWKLLHRLRQNLGRWLDLTIPQMARVERVRLYDKLQSGSEWNFDFMTLISLSTAIAALGLLQSSAAVVIGAMLVAPLMTPIIGAGLALVQGNLPLLKIAGRAIVLGYFMALMIGFAAGALFPIPELTPELLARGGPTLLDLGVAFLSGLAAAFCLGRPGLLAALPGVAIAAALVPPIATTGVSLALGEHATARGSALLFLTNVVAIVLGAAVSLYASGVRGKRGAGSHQKWVSYAFLALLLGTVVLAFPLGSGLRSQLYVGTGFEVPKALKGMLEQRLEQHPGIRLVKIYSRRDSGERVIRLELASPQPLSTELSHELAGIVREEVGSDLRVRIETRLSTVIP